MVRVFGGGGECEQHPARHVVLAHVLSSAPPFTHANTLPPLPFSFFRSLAGYKGAPMLTSAGPVTAPSLAAAAIS
jgi:hypothetical protein